MKTNERGSGSAREVEEEHGAHDLYPTMDTSPEIWQFWFEPLMEKIDALLQQHRAPEGQEEQQPSNVEERASHAQAHPDEGFADIIRKFLQEFNGNESNEMSRSGHATYQKPHVYESNEASGSGQSTEQPEGSLNNPKPKNNDLSIDQKLEIAPADLNHKDSA
ncbi:hypothetical protein ACP70R_009974 [Stipagrostis hirtigluma subsp. patula]